MSDREELVNYIKKHTGRTIPKNFDFLKGADEPSLLSKSIMSSEFNNLCNKVKTFENAVSHCNELGINISDIVFNINDTKSEIAIKKLKIIATALNEGWVPDSNNIHQRKLYNYVTVQDGNSVIKLNAMLKINEHTPPYVYFKTYAICKYAGEMFSELYLDSINNE